MPDTTIPKPLSGAEVRKAILHDIGRMLEQDDRFMGHIAYDGFTFSVTLRVSLPTGIQQELTRDLSGGPGVDPAYATELTELETSRGLQPPNDVRYSTDQPIPTLVENDKGQTEERWVSYKGKDRSGKLLGQKQVPDIPPSVQKVKRNVVKGVDIAS